MPRDKAIVEHEDVVSLGIELVRKHSGSMRYDEAASRYVATVPHTERGPYKCGCTTCGGQFVLARAICSGNCGCELSQAGRKP